MNPSMDRNDSLVNHDRSFAVMNEYLQRSNLCDIWRVRHPSEKRYTWHKWSRTHKPLCSRIDLLFVPDSMVDVVSSAKIELGHMSDHSLISVEVRIDDYKRGVGVWKFNNQLLLDEDFCENILKVIECNSTFSSLNDGELWENLKMELGTFSKKYSRKKEQHIKKEYCKLISLKVELEADMLKHPDNGDIVDNYNQVKESIVQHEVDEAEKTIFRSRCNYAKAGERCSKYFLSLEKRNYLEKNMKCICLDDGTVSTNQGRILKEITRFYRELYSADPSIAFNMQRGDEEACLSEEEKQCLDSDFLTDEFYDAVMTLKGGKVPGLDGLTVEFYRKFWKQLSPYLIRMYRYSYETGIFPESVREGLISLLPKKSRDTRKLSNMRPLSILNNDYKILAKAIDNRIRLTIPNIIHCDQTGFVKGRKICHNVRKSLDIIEWTKQESTCSDTVHRHGQVF